MKASILGHFGEGLNLLNGQTIKTKIITEELQNQFGQEQIIKFDTHGGIKNFFKSPFQVFIALRCSENVLIFPAHNGLRIYAPLLNFFRHFFKNRKIHYFVIGGWLSEFLNNKPLLTRTLKMFDCIYVETNIMKKSLRKKGFTNVEVIPNCKELDALEESALIYNTEEPYKLCTFSRVMKGKGIEEAIDVVEFVNELFGRKVYTLDIYGQVDDNQIEWFEKLKSEFPDFIKYRGQVSYKNSVETLKKYFVLLFPTKFYTEGIPGSIIDAYAAGIPVISSKWESFADIIDDKVTGVGYKFSDVEELKKVLINIAQNPHVINNMKFECLKKANDFIPKVALDKFVKKL